MNRFPTTSCSQCGQGFAAGNEGYSHCSDHREAGRALQATASLAHMARKSAEERLSLAEAERDQLLKAASKAVAEWDRVYPLMPRDDRFEDVEFSGMLALRAAIAKATGGRS